RFAIVGAGRTQFTDEQFRQHALQAMDRFTEGEPIPMAARERFTRLLYYFVLDYQDADDFRRLASQLARLDHDLHLEDNLVFYLANPPNAYILIARQLREAGLTCPAGGLPPGAAERPTGGARRIVVEKPFGRDTASAEALNRELRGCFPEADIYRIDHYLGKETVQNLLVFRFANGIFEPIWDRRYVDHVQITVAETVGVEHRAAYYETAGALRDMIQNHLLQLLCLTAMEPPATLAPEAVRDEKTKVLEAIRPIPPDRVLRFAARGQYGPGYVAAMPVPGYREEPGVAPDSRVETFAALKLRVDNWRWAGVPFYLRSGKRLPKRVSEIAIQFKEVPHRLFHPDGDDQIEPNTLALRIQPNEGITLRFQAKAPGLGLSLRSVNMEFCYGTAFGQDGPDAYERLLLDCLLGDPTLFARADWVILAWRLLDPVLRFWESPASGPVEIYEVGTWGPRAGQRLLQRDGRRWRVL
ncbi:MAG: glucose-6-phosphate dehydrogenase, partial [Armatimonadetes bacterium]|nr:glucose-6-phosphate dehydrogenase [Armatimonadota bacterium]